jgi:hypothetical protein
MSFPCLQKGATTTTLQGENRCISATRFNGYVWDNLPMLQFDPNDPEKMTFILNAWPLGYPA